MYVGVKAEGPSLSDICCPLVMGPLHYDLLGLAWGGTCVGSLETPPQDPPHCADPCSEPCSLWLSMCPWWFFLLGFL